MGDGGPRRRRKQARRSQGPVKKILDVDFVMAMLLEDMSFFFFNESIHKQEFIPGHLIHIKYILFIRIVITKKEN